MPRLKEEFIHEIIIEKSRFICYLNRAFNETEAKDYILQIKKLHPNATHHCSAFLMGNNNEMQRSNDDGEPSGTAGVPMLESLRKNEMNDVVAVVVRYFGGIKLGAGGLIRAYSKSVSEALQLAPLCEKKSMLLYQLTFSYDLIGKIDYFFNQHNCPILEKDYAEHVIYTYLCEEPMDEAFNEMSSGKAKNIFIEQQIVEVDL